MDGSPKAFYEIVTHNYGPFNAAVSKYIEKLEQPDPRVASETFREKARGVGHVVRSLGAAVLLTLIGVSLVVWCQERKPASAASEPGILAKWPNGVPEPSPAGGTGHQLYTVHQCACHRRRGYCHRVELRQEHGQNPEFQYCHLRTPDELGNRIIGIAQRSQSGALIRHASANAFNDIVSEIDYETALSKCRWFSKSGLL
ncbi:MAG: hypothetical protein ACXWHG_15670 [Thermoanaerobaculia bacterium]